MTTTKKLRIVHCVRSPFGGIFRHILDLAHQQHAEGHDVGLILDSETCTPFEEAKIEAETASLTLGFAKFPIKRQIGPSDLMSSWRMYKALQAMNPDVVHTHGAKGGALGRIAASFLSNKPIRLYCPHGGSLHFDQDSLKGRIFFSLEKILEKVTDSLIFVSEYEMRSYFTKVGQPKISWSLSYNGLRDHEFTSVPAQQDAYDFLMIGQLRDLKGPDLFIDAMKQLHEQEKKATGLIVGSGEDEDKYHEMVRDYGLNDYIDFTPPMPAVEAFAKAHCVVVPSRAESMPYIVLETIGAQKPLIATHVGGIPEIFGDLAHHLVPPDNAHALAQSMAQKLDSKEMAQVQASQLLERIKDGFSLATMNRTIMDEYNRSFHARSDFNQTLTTNSKNTKNAA